MLEKECTQCRTVKPLDQFPWGKDKRLRAGGAYKSECKACASARAGAYQRANYDRCVENQKRWRAKNKERWLAAVNRATKRYLQARKAQCPAWADHAKIAEVYETARLLREAGFDAEVDHIVPLQGRDASGLHVHWNLQIVTRRQNLQKRDSVDPNAHYAPNAWDTFCAAA